MRYKLPVAFTLALFCLVTVFAVVATFQAIRIKDQRDLIVEERDRALTAESEAKAARAAEAEARSDADEQADVLWRSLYLHKIALAQSAYHKNDIERNASPARGVCGGTA